jgi:Tol biopolymer transport system component
VVGGHRSHRARRVAAAVVAVAATTLGTTGFTYTTLVSGPSGSDAAAAATTLPSNFPTVSGDGRYVAFLSPAGNLVASDINGLTDAFVRDVLTNTTSLLSVAGTIQANGPTMGVVAASDGRHFGFTAGASNLAPNDGNGNTDVFVRDTVAKTTTMVSVTPAGASGNATSVVEGLSSDGRYVAFDSLSSNIVAGDTNAVADVFVRDMTTGLTTRASVGSTGQQLSTESTDADLSATGRYLAFVTRSSGVVPGVGNGATQVYLRDLTTGAVTLVSRTSTGAPGAGEARAPSVSADGKTVVFESAAGDLVAGDTNGVPDIFRYDANTSSVTRISIGPGGVQADAASSLS